MDEQNRLIKVKTYPSDSETDLGLVVYLFYILSAGMAIYLMVSESDMVKLLWGIIGCIAFPTLFLAANLLCIYCGRMYDVYTEAGMKRVKKDKVIFEIPWSNVKEITYKKGFPLLAPTGIVAVLKEPILLMVNEKAKKISYQKLDFYVGAMKKKTALAIEKQFLPPGLKIQFK